MCSAYMCLWKNMIYISFHRNILGFKAQKRRENEKCEKSYIYTFDFRLLRIIAQKWKSFYR